MVSAIVCGLRVIKEIADPANAVRHSKKEFWFTFRQNVVRTAAHERFEKININVSTDTMDVICGVSPNLL